MGVFFNKIDKEQLKPGDHIYSWRQAYLYAHHGLTVLPLSLPIFFSGSFFFFFYFFFSGNKQNITRIRGKNKRYMDMGR